MSPACGSGSFDPWLVTESGRTLTLMAEEGTRTGQAWRRRPVLGNLVRALIVLGPLAFSVVVGLLVASALPRPSAALVMRAGWSLAVMSASTLALVLAGRMARRLLPLSLLLRVGVVFPDAAPRRFGIALRAVRPGKGGDDEDPASALSLLAALLTHDRRTRGHSERVAAYALLIADELGLDESARNEVRWAGLLHDVGKIDVPPEILNKPGGLDEDEWAVMSSHPASGAVRVAPLRPWLGDAVAAVDGHHERWDGTGYPHGLVAADLPLSTRIVALADAVETMTAARSYKTPMSMHEARAEVAGCSGGQFDPVVARAFLGVSVPRLWRVAGPLAWLAQVPLLGAVLQGSLAPGAALAQAAVVTAGQMAATAALVGTALVTTGGGPPPQASVERSAARATALTSRAHDDVGGVRGTDEAEADRALRPAVSVTNGPGRPVPGHGPAGGPGSSSGGNASGGGSAGPVDGDDPETPTVTTPPLVVPPGDSPGPVVPPPGQGGVPPGQGGVPPGNGGVPPGQDDGGVPPGQGNGDAGEPPGQGNGNGQGNRHS